MREIINFFNYEMHLGSEIVITPKVILIIFSVFFTTYLFLKFFKKIALRALNNETRSKFRSIFTFLNYSIYLIVILITLDTVGVNVTAIYWPGTSNTNSGCYFRSVYSGRSNCPCR